jgi:hypothetical protein
VRFSDVTDWSSAETDPVGNKVWIVTNIKTRDTYAHDALIVPHQFVGFVDAYVKHIRSSFLKNFRYRKRTPQQTDVQTQHKNGLYCALLE